MICLRHRTASARVPINVWEFDPVRRFGGSPTVIAIVQQSDSPLVFSIPVCAPREYDFCIHAEHDHTCFRGHILAPFGPAEWLIGRYGFNGQLPVDSILLTHTPLNITEELRNL